MSLQSGDRLGPYEISAPIGAGGMGEVYKATDTRLERTVAIKVLPAHVASDPDLKQRFEREAKTISSLNHPHICTLYDVGEADVPSPQPPTPSPDKVRYLVMEYLEGETLAQRLRGGALPIDESLRYAIEIADALDKAHRQGVTHRDVKPGNIMLTKAGSKLLDFGLAKLKAGGPGRASGSGGSGRETALPTVSANLTAQGSILGTLQYMAPEQLEGNDADARGDIFAFGAVLYEMVTGKRAFAGKSQASLIGAILKDDPPALSSVQTLTPPTLDHVVSRCLAKDPDDRWQTTARDLTSELKFVTEGSAQTTVVAPVTVAPSSSRRRLLMPVALAAVLGALIAGVGIWSVMRVAPTPARLTRFVVNTAPDAPLQPTATKPDVAISPDGSLVVFLANSQLYVRRLDQLQATPLRGSELGQSPAFSPDGEWVAFEHVGDRTIKQVSILGGPPMTIAETGSRTQGISWGPDDTIVFATEASRGLMRVPAVGGEPEVLTTAGSEQGETSHRWPEILPNGRAVLFTAESGSADASRIAVASMETGEVTYLVPGGSNPRYVPTGYIVYGVGGTLQAVGFDAERLAIIGNPVPVLEEVETKDSGAANFGISEDGSLVYVSGGVSEGRTLLWVDREGRSTPVVEATANYVLPQLSPDGTRVAVNIGGGAGDVWICEVDRACSRLTAEGGNFPIWTPDGTRVTFNSNRSGNFDLYWKPADGGGEAELLLARDGDQYPLSWSPDGQVLAFSEQAGPGSPGGSDIWILPLGGEPEEFAVTSFSEHTPSFSPDGRWVAYRSNESGRMEVYVRPYPGPGGRQLVSIEGGQEPVWSRDGRELFFRDNDRLMAVDVESGATFSSGTPGFLFEGYDVRGGNRNFDVSPDGQRFVMVGRPESQSGGPAIHVVLNWAEELRVRVPVN